MSHSDQIELLATDIGAKLKAVKTLLNANTADNAALLTTEKSSLLGAVNELHGLIVAGAATIDDASTGTASAWSASKVQAVVDASSVATRDAIIGGAPASYDTLIELMTELQSNDTDISAALASIAANTTAITAAQADATQALADAAGALAAAGVASTAAATADAKAVTAQTAANTAQSAVDTLTINVGATETNYVATFQAALT